ncbi:hypothetical protein AMECASPLE_039277 [Ameca splendens]|uniref:Uncharacterized protein n=1 Tax=Ameca splendens TaxID=208324 RepID=A0ABV0Y8N9_9TELE
MCSSSNGPSTGVSWSLSAAARPLTVLDSSSAILGFLQDPLTWFPPLQLHSSSLLGDAALPLLPAVYLSYRKKEINFLNLHSVP